MAGYIYRQCQKLSIISIVFIFKISYYKIKFSIFKIGPMGHGRKVFGFKFHQFKGNMIKLKFPPT